MKRRPPRLSDVEFRHAIDDAKERHRLSDIIGRRTKLKRRGAREMVGLCPFHTEKTPSFEVNDDKGTYYCHGCGEGGDHMTFLTKADGMTFGQAFEALTGNHFPVVSEAERAQRKQQAEEVTARRIQAGRRVWAGAVPAAGTLAEVYLRERGIRMRLLCRDRRSVKRSSGTTVCSATFRRSTNGTMYSANPMILTGRAPLRRSRSAT
ncbi:CHC2 zinc finger domain-containing protein [Sphingomonas sp. Leaf4]|uniref:CHC2 zinc finger domain-containing protein n=1 Tax=Sphingomonas sp. Leaf4 TaxID=2876553 RepID=UPI001E4ED10C|nr:CHC2 zinc finger domain-containing protein [Sphingomonas sp. Leaf4]